MSIYHDGRELKPLTEQEKIDHITGITNPSPQDIARRITGWLAQVLSTQTVMRGFAISPATIQTVNNPKRQFSTNCREWRNPTISLVGEENTEQIGEAKYTYRAQTASTFRAGYWIEWEFRPYMRILRSRLLETRKLNSDGKRLVAAYKFNSTGPDDSEHAYPADPFKISREIVTGTVRTDHLTEEISAAVKLWMKGGYGSASPTGFFEAGVEASIGYNRIFGTSTDTLDTETQVEEQTIQVPHNTICDAIVRYETARIAYKIERSGIMDADIKMTLGPGISNRETDPRDYCRLKGSGERSFQFTSIEDFILTLLGKRHSEYLVDTVPATPTPTLQNPRVNLPRIQMLH